MGGSSPRPMFSRLATLNENRWLLLHRPSIVLRENSHFLCLGHVFICKPVPVTERGEGWGGKVHVNCTVWAKCSSLWWRWQALTPEKIPLCLISSSPVTCLFLNHTSDQRIVNIWLARPESPVSLMWRGSGAGCATENPGTGRRESRSWLAKTKNIKRLP